MYQTAGIVIKKTDIGEADRILTIFTQDFGKIDALARGIRKLEAKLLGHSELFCQSHFMLSPGTFKPILTGAFTTRNFVSLRSDFNKLNTAFRVAKALDEAIAGPQKEPAIWNLALSVFSELDSSPSLSAEKIFCFFQANLLKHLGHKPEIWKCANCENKLIQKNNYFSPQKGGVVCQNCRVAAIGAFPINVETIKILRLFLTKNLTTAKKLKLKNSELEDLKLVLNRFVNYHFK